LERVRERVRESASLFWGRTAHGGAHGHFSSTHTVCVCVTHQKVKELIVVTTR